MKQLMALQQQGRRRNASAQPDSTVDGAIKSPATIFWLVIHAFCCLISLVIGFRFSRVVFFLIFSTSSNSSNLIYSAIHTKIPYSDSPDLTEMNVSGASAGSRVVVGRHGILIRPWPHPDPTEVMKAQRIIERVQTEQRNQHGVKNPRTVIAITPTYVRTFQTLHLTGAMHCLMNVPYDVVWIVVEAGGTTNETASVISKSGLKIIHIGFDGKMPVLWEDRHKFETKMRLQALRVVRENSLDGVVTFIDDSNMHSLEFFDEIQTVKRVGAVSVGILTHSGGSDEADSKKDGKISQVPVQGPVCNASNHLIGWYALPFLDKSARYVSERAVVLPRKLEWAGFVLNSRLVWELEDVGGNGENVESPLSLLKDGSIVEPLGDCGKKVMVWWLRVEARADSKFPARWTIDPPLDITIPAKRTPLPDAPPEIPFSGEKVTSIPENTEKRGTKSGSRRKRSSQSKKRHITKVVDEHGTITTTGDI